MDLQLEPSITATRKTLYIAIKLPRGPPGTIRGGAALCRLGDPDATRLLGRLISILRGRALISWTNKRAESGEATAGGSAPATSC